MPLFFTFLLVRCFLPLCLAAPLAALGAAVRAIPEQTGLVVDQTGSLDEGAQLTLLRRLGAIQASGRAQVVILVVGDTAGEALADYSLKVAQAWKLGHAGRDDGLLVLVVPGAVAARLEVGYGLEGSIPDVRAAQWIDEILLPAMKSAQLAAGLHRLLDQVDAALPAAQVPAQPAENILDRHPEWKLPFVLAVFSPLALFPLFIGRSGSLVSAPLFAVFWGLASWVLWSTRSTALGVGGIAFTLPLLWGLNRSATASLSHWLQYAKHIGNLAAVAIFFSVITIFVGAALSGTAVEVWAAPLFAGPLALGLAAFLFPGKPAYCVMLLLTDILYTLADPRVTLK